jgi:hypothetical protein
MAITRQGGPGINLDTKPMPGNNNYITLAAGEFQIIPSGQFYVNPGLYTLFQVKDPITGLWAPDTAQGSGLKFVTSDGANLRLANLTGCAVGAFVTNVGSGYTSAPTVTASAGGSTWTAIVGGAINQTVTITTAGAGYNFAPQLVVSAPPTGGVQATATCTISAGAINAVTVVNQGAGYLAAPTVTVVPDPRESSQTSPGPTTAGVLTAALTGSGTITAVLLTGHGTPLTSVPTLTFSGGGGASAAATVAMCFTATGFTVTTAGVAYGNAQPFLVVSGAGPVGGSAGAVINPTFGQNIVTPRQCNILGTSTSGGAVTATGLVINDGGLFATIPTAFVIPGNSVPTTQGAVALTVGGVSDTSLIQPF